MHKNNLGRLVSIIGINCLGRLVSLVGKNMIQRLVSKDDLTYTVDFPDKLVSYRVKIILRDLSP